MITWGTLSTAFYEAHVMAPDNENVVASLAEGLPNAAVYHSRTPADVIRFLRDYHNQFHNGSGYSVIELLQDIGYVYIKIVCSVFAMPLVMFRMLLQCCDVFHIHASTMCARTQCKCAQFSTVCNCSTSYHIAQHNISSITNHMLCSVTRSALLIYRITRCCISTTIPLIDHCWCMLRCAIALGDLVCRIGCCNLKCPVARTPCRHNLLGHQPVGGGMDCASA